MERPARIVESVKQKSKKAAAFGLLAAVAVLAGCSGKTYPYKPAERDAVGKYDDAFHRASPAGKFILQYLRITKVEEREQDVSFGDDDSNFEIYINNGCLFNTAYDIAGGTIKGDFHGFLSSGHIEGNSPTAAANAFVSSKRPDVITIESGHSSSRDLHFSGVAGDSPLAPMDQQTKDVLATNGCQIGETKHIIVSRFDATSSPWISTTDPIP